LVHAFEERHGDATGSAEGLAEVGGGGRAVLFEVIEDEVLGGLEGGGEEDGLVAEGDDAVGADEEGEGAAGGAVGGEFGAAGRVEGVGGEGGLDTGGGFADVVGKTGGKALAGENVVGGADSLRGEAFEEMGDEGLGEIGGQCFAEVLEGEAGEIGLGLMEIEDGLLGGLHDFRPPGGIREVVAEGDAGVGGDELVEGGLDLLRSGTKGGGEMPEGGGVIPAERGLQ